MDSVRIRTRRGTLRLESGSELESADEGSRKTRAAAGDSLAMTTTKDQETITMETISSQQEAIQEDGETSVTRSRLYAASGGSGATVQPPKGAAKEAQRMEREAEDSSGIRMLEDMDVPSHTYQDRPLDSVLRDLQLSRGDRNPKLSADRRVTSRDPQLLGVLDQSGRRDQFTADYSREQPGLWERAPRELMRRPPPLTSRAAGSRSQGPARVEQQVTTGGGAARRPVHGRTVHDLSRLRRMNEVPQDDDANDRCPSDVDMLPAYEEEELEELYRRQPPAATRSARSRLSQGARRSRREVYSSSEESAGRNRHDRHGRAKLPPFTAKERWDVWFNRFKDVALRRGWSVERKLDELIPLIQGAAGDFVYGQLSERTRQNYDLLIQELTYRYRTVEPRRTMGAKFSHRVQKPGETVQEFAAELKRLYDKAHPDRDRQTRTEDLLRKFLDGLRDDNASFHVEYVKEPSDIDDAVNEVINFVETRRRPEGNNEVKKPRRAARLAMDDDDDEDEQERIARLPGRPPKKPSSGSTAPATAGVDNSQINKAENPCLDEFKKFNSELELLKRRIENMEHRQVQRPRPAPRQFGGNPRPAGNGQAMQQSLGCYKCGQVGHFARGCVNHSTVMGQFQMTTPSDARLQFMQASNPSGDQAKEQHPNQPQGN